MVANLVKGNVPTYFEIDTKNGIRKISVSNFGRTFWGYPYNFHPKVLFRIRKGSKVKFVGNLKDEQSMLASVALREEIGLELNQTVVVRGIAYHL